ncbi:ATP-dependent RNA helicase ROK1, putative [Plasmodium malariae]|uniref:RNA helicase n=1 Tax=Plasmodium malariae TaxID=5858 RepID=A0A1D3JJH4_PLAMA|nr:ATP-dependent RNA helicase ROK1, putative [Plasmodium malariae]SBT86644.1 ATP-dependent RNA helicase ROK1, putative [Plasmodium malariae]
MDVARQLMYGLNLKGLFKNDNFLSLKEENLKPLRNILKIKKKNELDDNDNKKKKFSSKCESITFEQFYNDEQLISRYMKDNEINIDYVHLNRNVVPIRFFDDIVNCVKMLRKDGNRAAKGVSGNSTNNIYSDNNLKEILKNKEVKKDGLPFRPLDEVKKKNKQIGEGESEQNEAVKGVEKKKKKKKISNDEIINEECKKLMDTVKNTLCFINPTSIQKICIPAILSGFNTICISQTGSGKTCAFLIPLLVKLNSLNVEGGNDVLLNGSSNDSVSSSSSSSSSCSNDSDNNSKSCGRSSSSSRNKVREKEDIFFIRSLIIVPTNELATQIYEQAIILFESFRKYVLIHLRKAEDIKQNVDVCVCTPMVLVHLIEKKKEKVAKVERKAKEAKVAKVEKKAEKVKVAKEVKAKEQKEEKKVSLEKCFFVVFDEVDKLFEVNFLEHLNCLLKEVQNKKIQKIFTTATLPGNTKSFISTLCTNYVVVFFGKSMNTVNSNVRQELLYVNNEEEKLLVLNNLIRNKEIHIPALIFVDTISKAHMVYASLSKSSCISAGKRSGNGICSVIGNGNGYSDDRTCAYSYIGLLTSERTKEERGEMFQRFQSGHIWYLICTDVMSRGIDIKGIETVINYDVCYDKYSYIHRIGRACRSDRKEGKAITFFTKDNIIYMKDIVKFVKGSGTQVPAYLENYHFKKVPQFKYFVKMGSIKKRKILKGRATAKRGRYTGASFKNVKR